MKFLRMLCIVITFVMLFGSLSVTRIFAAQYDTSPLQNTYHKLTAKKELTIGYIGGSVTSGTGASNLYTKSWRALTTKWFETQFPEAKITERSMSVGGTGTVYALHRVEKALLTGNVPDLVFIETAINDSYDGISGDPIRVYLESLIKKIYAKNPKCDIVIVIIGDFNVLRKARQTGELFRPEHREIANHYNIPIIDIGTEFYQRIYKANGNEDIYVSSDPAWQKHFEDSVHPNDGGYAEYAKLVQNYLSGELVSKKLDASVFSNKYIPKKTYMQNLMLDAYDVDFKDFDFESNPYFLPEEYRGVFASFNGIFSKRIGDTFTVEFAGTSFMIWTHPTTNPTSASDTVIRYSIDGGKKQTLKITAGFHGVYQLAKDLAPGKHKIKIIYMDNAQKHKLIDMFIAGDPSMSGVKFTIDPSDDDLEEEVESENVGTTSSNRYPTYDDDDDYYETNDSSADNNSANNNFANDSSSNDKYAGDTSANNSSTNNSSVNNNTVNSSFVNSSFTNNSSANNNFINNNTANNSFVNSSSTNNSSANNSSVNNNTVNSSFVNSSSTNNSSANNSSVNNNTVNSSFVNSSFTNNSSANNSFVNSSFTNDSSANNGSVNNNTVNSSFVNSSSTNNSSANNGSVNNNTVNSSFVNSISANNSSVNNGTTNASQGDTSSKTDTCINHTFSSWRETEKATCTTKGVYSRTCLNCGYEETEYSEYSNHAFEENQVTKEATIYSVGIEEGKCIHCGETTQQEIMCNARDNDTQLYFETNVGTFDEGTELKVNKLSKSDELYKSSQKALKCVSKNFVAYNISALQNGNAVQPKGELKIVLPVPEGYENVEIYQIDENSEPKKLEAVLSFDGKSATANVTELGTIAICNRIVKESNVNSLAIIGAALGVFAVLLVTAVVIVWLKLKKA